MVGIEQIETLSELDDRPDDRELLVLELGPLRRPVVSTLVAELPEVDAMSEPIPLVLARSERLVFQQEPIRDSSEARVVADDSSVVAHRPGSPFLEISHSAPREQTVAVPLVQVPPDCGSRGNLA